MARKPEDMSEEELIAKIFFYQQFCRVMVRILTPCVPLMRAFSGGLWYVFHGTAVGALWFRDRCYKSLGIGAGG